MDLNVNKSIIRSKAVNNTDSFHILFQLEGGGSITLTKAPTANCQLYSLGAAMNLFKYSNWPSIMAVIHRASMKKRVLIDIPTTRVAYIKDFFKKEDIIMENDYVNSTYSTKMTLMILSTTKLAELSKKIMVDESNRLAEEAKKAEEKAKKVVESVIDNAEPVVKRKVGRPKKVQPIVAEKPQIVNGGIMEQIQNISSQPYTTINAFTLEEVREALLVEDDQDDWDEDGEQYSEQEQQELEEAENRAFEARMDEEARIANSVASDFNPF